MNNLNSVDLLERLLALSEEAHGPDIGCLELAALQEQIEQVKALILHRMSSVPKDLDAKPDVTELVRANRCKCGNESQEEYECPYNEISGSDSQCNCCDNCRSECRDALSW